MPPESTGCTVWLNGEAVQTAAANLHALLAERGFDATQRAFACAVNGAFVPRGRWAEQALAAQDRIDIVAPVVGG